MRRLSYGGVIGPLLFIVVVIVEGLTRPGYSAWRNFVSQLATGPGGWVQILNFFVCGLLVLCFAIGLRDSIKGTRGSIGAPVLLGLFAVGLLIAGAFVTDPQLGYPAGAQRTQTWHGIVHALAGLAAFGLLTAAAFVMAWHFTSRPNSRFWTRYSVTVAVLIIVFFFASQYAAARDASGLSPNAPGGFLQRIAIIVGWTWIAMVALNVLRLRRPRPSHRARPNPAASGQETAALRERP